MDTVKLFVMIISLRICQFLLSVNVFGFLFKPSNSVKSNVLALATILF